jgi:GMC oxidoreductase
MGSHAMAVVDDRPRVYGLEGLRGIDASVMPAVTSTNTNAPTIMIVEKGPRHDQRRRAIKTGGVTTTGAVRRRVSAILICTVSVSR